MQVTNSHGDGLLHMAINAGNEDSTTALIPLGININTQNGYASDLLQHYSFYLCICVATWH
jgi:ankyrin repeat protein